MPAHPPPLRSPFGSVTANLPITVVSCLFACRKGPRTSIRMRQSVGGQMPKGERARATAMKRPREDRSSGGRCDIAPATSVHTGKTLAGRKEPLASTASQLQLIVNPGHANSPPEKFGANAEIICGVLIRKTTTPHPHEGRPRQQQSSAEPSSLVLLVLIISA
jgi:hypothetical protein